jgi:uncharacterized membrane protein
MLNLAAAALTFFALHRVISGSRLRDRIVALIGETAFRRVFALASFACLTWLWLGFQSARASPWNVQLFTPRATLELLQIPLQLLAFLLIVAGITTRNPTTAGMAAMASDRNIVRGTLRITRHPFLWGVPFLRPATLVRRPACLSGNRPAMESHFPEDEAFFTLSRHLRRRASATFQPRGYGLAPWTVRQAGSS